MANRSAKPWRLAAAQLICSVLPPILGKRIGKRIYPPAYARHDDYQFLRRSRTGSPLSGTTSDVTGHIFSIHGYFELRAYAFAKAFCQPGDTVIEIGANVGTETVGLSDIVGKQGRVIAFEPVLDHVAVLQTNLRHMRYANVDLRAAAVGEMRGTVQFVLPRSPLESGAGRVLTTEADSADTNIINVPCVRLDDLLGEVDSCKFIAMDAEGSEINILRGGRQFLSTFKPAILCEANARQLAKAGCSVRDLFDELAGIGYIVQDTSARQFSDPSFDFARKADWLCVHRDHADQIARAQTFMQRALLMPFLFGLNPIR
jgi:FkbM family methyltransferase